MFVDFVYLNSCMSWCICDRIINNFLWTVFLQFSPEEVFPFDTNTRCSQSKNNKILDVDFAAAIDINHVDYRFFSFIHQISSFS